MPGNISPRDGEKVFAGVRFVLFGFDSVSEVQYRSELIMGGGVDVGRCDQSCTHLIVSGRVYDDPVCVAARNDGKTVVTELWIEDSVDFGAVADAKKVLYRPVRDLNGIPESETLFICLTGYQRPERDAIMKMVNLMGAHFSKPLIAAKVTHLICYKFEGEKYELAKRVNIKLVNHRWLEDCLKEWKILPVDEYEISGWELEIMEAEARDSDEETEEDTHMKQLAKGRIVDEVSCFPRDMPSSGISKSSSPSETLAIKQVCSPDKVLNHNFEDIHTTKQLLSTPSKDSKSVGTSDDRYTVFGDCSNSNNDIGGRDCYVKETIHNVPIVLESTVNLNKQNNKHTAGDIIDHTGSDGEDKFLGYSRKKRRTSLPTNNVSKKIDSFHETLLENDASILQIKQDANNSAITAIQGLATSANPNHMEDPSTASPLKRKVARLGFYSVASKSGYESLKASPPEKSQRDSVSAEFGVLLGNNAAWDEVDCSPAGERSPDEMVLVNPMVPQDRISSKSKSTTPKQVSKNDSTSRTNNAASLSSGQLTNLLCSTGSIKQQDNQKSTSVDQCSKLVNVQNLNPLISPICKISTSSNMSIHTPLPTNGQDADSMSLKCKASPVKESANSLWPDNGDISGTRVSDIQNGAWQDERPTDERPLPCSGMRISPKLVQSGIGHNSSAKTLIKKATAKRKLGCKLKTSVVNNAEVTACSEGSIKRNVEGDSDRNTEVAASISRSSVTKDKLTGYDSVSKENNVKLGVCMDSHFAEKAMVKESSSKLEKVKDLTLKEPGDVKVVRGNDKVKSASGDVKVQQKTKNAHKPLKKSSTKKNLKGSNDRNTEVAATISESSATKDNVTGYDSVSKHDNVKLVVCMDSHLTVEKVKSESTDVKMQQKTKNGHRVLKKISTKRENAASAQTSSDAEKENKPEEIVLAPVKSDKNRPFDIGVKDGQNSVNEIMGNHQRNQKLDKVSSEPSWFILSGSRWQRKEFQMIVRHLSGRLCNDSHHWSYKATHFIVPEPIRRTEKFFAAAASGRWILKTDYLTASKEAGKFLREESFEWHRNGLTEDGAISLEAPRKWRLLRERTGHGAFYGMRIITYGESILPPMDTLKRVVKAGDGAILATSPPYTRFLKSGIDFAVIGAGMPHVDLWIQEFMRHEIPCILADYLVEYVCKPGFSLDKNVLYKTHAWAERSFANLLMRSEEIIATDDSGSPSEDPDDLSCSVCGSRDRGEVMLVCGDEKGSGGCGIGTHIDCCDPPFDAVPEEDWFCADCTEKMARKIPVKGRKKR